MPPLSIACGGTIRTESHKLICYRSLLLIALLCLYQQCFSSSCERAERSPLFVLQRHWLKNKIGQHTMTHLELVATYRYIMLNVDSTRDLKTSCLYSSICLMDLPALRTISFLHGNAGESMLAQEWTGPHGQLAGPLAYGQRGWRTVSAMVGTGQHRDGQREGQSENIMPRCRCCEEATNEFIDRKCRSADPVFGYWLMLISLLD